MLHQSVFREAARPANQGLLSENYRPPISQSNFQISLFFAAILSFIAAILLIKVPLGYTSQGVIHGQQLRSVPVIKREGVLTFLRTVRDPVAVHKDEKIAVVRSLDSTILRRAPNVAFALDSLKKRRSELAARRLTLEKNKDSQVARLTAIGSHIRTLVSETEAQIAFIKTDLTRAKDAEAQSSGLFERKLIRRAEMDISLDSVSQKRLQLKQAVIQLEEYEKMSIENDIQINQESDRFTTNATQIDQQLYDIDSEIQLTEDLEDQEILASSDGILLPRSYAVGDVVKPGDVIFDYSPALDDLEVEMDVPESQVGRIKQGMAASIVLNAFPSDRYGLLRGQVVSISQVTTDNLRFSEKLPTISQFRVVVRAENTAWRRYRVGKTIYHGMFADVSLEAERLPVWQVIFAPLVRLGKRVDI
jgi:membrane fusion protein